MVDVVMEIVTGLADEQPGRSPHRLGQASYVEHRGERPIAITWRLNRPMPADTFAAASAVAQ